MSYYRSLWIKTNGEIPLDSNGVSYEVHHLDGNRKNNDISNLICISLQEHFDIHYKQGDWFACKLIQQKLDIPENIRAEVLANAGVKTSKALTGRKHPNRGVNISKALTGKKQPNISKALKGRKRPCITKALLGTTRPQDVKDKIRNKMKNQPITICPHCKKEGKGGNMKRYHFDNCKSLRNG